MLRNSHIHRPQKAAALLNCIEDILNTVTLSGCFKNLRALFVGVLILRALLGVQILGLVSFGNSHPDPLEASYRSVIMASRARIDLTSKKHRQLHGATVETRRWQGISGRYDFWARACTPKVYNIMACWAVLRTLLPLFYLLLGSRWNAKELPAIHRASKRPYSRSSPKIPRGFLIWFKVYSSI